MNNIKFFKYKIRQFNSIWIKCYISFLILSLFIIFYAYIDIFLLNIFSEDSLNSIVMVLLFINSLTSISKDFFLKLYLSFYKDKIDDQSLKYIKKLSIFNIVSISVYYKLYYDKISKIYG